MRSLGTLLRVAHVWLTAVMVLIAGSPYVSCHCPDGHRKLFCFSSLAPVNGCCNSGAVKEKAPCRPCCKDQSDASSDLRCRIDEAGCTKTLTSPSVVVVNDAHETAPNLALSTLFVSTLSPSLALPASGSAHSPLAWRDYHSPPPLDPLAALRHLLI